MLGLEREVIHTRLQPVGLAGQLPVRPNVSQFPLYPYISGFRDVSGDVAAGVCDDPQIAGPMKTCLQTAPFGRYSFMTREMEINRVGQQINRGEFMDLTLVNEPLASKLGSSIFPAIPSAQQALAGAEVLQLFDSWAGVGSGVSVRLVGRWAIALGRGTLQHRDIRESVSHRHEIAAGWLFHYFIGGGAVALLLAIGWQLTGVSAPLASPLPYLLFGFATSVLPWLILLPSFGWGLAGRHGPAGSNALLTSTPSHIPYGLGIWLTVVAVNAFFYIKG